jgi:hypothetical protein
VGGGQARRQLTFKENVPDLRNSRAIDVIERLVVKHDVEVADPLAGRDAVREEYGPGLSIVDGRLHRPLDLSDTSEYRALTDHGCRAGRAGRMLAGPQGALAWRRGRWSCAVWTL